MIFIITQEILYVAGRLTANKNHTLWFLILLKVPLAVLLFTSLTVKVWTLTTASEYTFSLYYRILIQGGNSHSLIFIAGESNFIEYLQSYQILIFIYYKFYYFYYNTVYSVCCRYTRYSFKQKQGSICLLSIRRKSFLFIHIVPGNIFDFWNSDFLKKSQLDLPSAWIFSLPSPSHVFFFLSFSLAWIFFFSHPPPITFLMVRP